MGEKTSRVPEANVFFLFENSRLHYNVRPNLYSFL